MLAQAISMRRDRPSQYETSCEQVQKEVFWLSGEPFRDKPLALGVWTAAAH